MHILTGSDHRNLVIDSLVIERDLHGEKVLSLKDGNYLKLFRRKRLISSTVWYPYAQRFADNALALRKRGIPSPEVIAVYRIPDIRRDAVLYRPLPGNTLRQLVREKSVSCTLRQLLTCFIAQLHDSGIYFRSIHLGNIVLTPDNKLGLIDIADMRIYDKPLPGYLRSRNLRHLHRVSEDRLWLGETA